MLDKGAPFTCQLQSKLRLLSIHVAEGHLSVLAPIKHVVVVHDVVCLHLLATNKEFPLEGLPFPFVDSLSICCERKIDFSILLNSVKNTICARPLMLHNIGDVVIMLE
jgi:hypothetical protein